MKQALVCFCSGVLFAFGLGISGMTQPTKVSAFLDFAGDWDPTLLFVMLGAIGVYAAGYPFVMRKSKPLIDNQFTLPSSTKIDKRLLLGASLFGMGWGMAGFCPGPALTALATFNPQAIVFVTAMVLGMLLFERRERAL